MALSTAADWLKLASQAVGHGASGWALHTFVLHHDDEEVMAHNEHQFDLQPGELGPTGRRQPPISIY